jgi:hypothetical protein
MEFSGVLSITRVGAGLPCAGGLDDVLDEQAAIPAIPAITATARDSRRPRKILYNFIIHSRVTCFPLDRAAPVGAI